MGLCLGALLILRGLDLLTHGKGYIEGLSLPINGESQGVADLSVAHNAHQFRTAGDFLAADMGDNVVDLDASLGSRGVSSDGLDRSALGQTIALSFSADGGNG